MSKEQNKRRMYLHGECAILEIPYLPSELKKRSDKDSITIAKSETIGNEHRIKIKEGVEFYEDAHGILYMKNTTPTKIYCLHSERHETIEIPEGIWQIDKAVEYDHLTAKIIEVLD